MSMSQNPRQPCCARCGQRFRARESRYHDILTGKDYHVSHAPQATVPTQDLGFRPASELLGESSTHSTRTARTQSARHRQPKRRIVRDY
jgi:hypothetical protein